MLTLPPARLLGRPSSPAHSRPYYQRVPAAEFVRALTVFILAIILSVLLIAEFVMAPINLWTGRTMPLFTKFTGHSPEVARTVFAPVKLLGAVLVAIGLAVKPLSIAGAVILAAVCGYYLVRLAAPGRRESSGVAAFLLFGAWAVGLLAAQLAR